MLDQADQRDEEFQSTLSMRRATSFYFPPHDIILVFQSTLSMRRATYVIGYTGGMGIFQSTLSMRRATSIVVSVRPIHRHFNPRSP